MSGGLLDIVGFDARTGFPTSICFAPTPGCCAWARALSTGHVALDMDVFPPGQLRHQERGRLLQLQGLWRLCPDRRPSRHRGPVPELRAAPRQPACQKSLATPWTGFCPGSGNSLPIGPSFQLHPLCARWQWRCRFSEAANRNAPMSKVLVQRCLAHAQVSSDLVHAQTTLIVEGFGGHSPFSRQLGSSLSGALPSVRGPVRRSGLPAFAR